MFVPAPFRRFRQVCYAFFASLAMVAQLAVALAPLDEGREQRRGAHIEADGVTHYTHSEATCAACQARSILGTASEPSVPLFSDAIVAAAPHRRRLDVVYSEPRSQDNPRAPPA
jgi:hypothetical protein